MKTQQIHNISEIQEALQKLLYENTYFKAHDVSILCENTKDIEYQIKSAISKIGCVATINTPSLTYIGKYENHEPAWKLNGITISVAEIPVTNRGRANYSTALDTALQIAETLAEKTNLNLVDIQQSEMGGYIMATVSFDSNITFRYEKRTL